MPTEEPHGLGLAELRPFTAQNTCVFIAYVL